jgi:phospholipase A-2-activating protein
MWDLSGQRIANLVGHESFIYALGCLPTGEIVSSGEDRTVRIWSQGSCIQTITLPALSVWSIAVNPESGDIVSGSSDRIVRVFTQDPKRVADAETLAEFEDSVKSSAIPQQQMGEVNKEKLPGPEFLTQKSGTKEGQVAMVREADGSVTAHTWSVGAQQWVNVGTVVDSAASSGQKTEYLGKDYDYVFDVDIEDGKPPLKLPYNLSQNPYEAATKFIQDNELPMTYLDEVANFITKNTQGATIGQGSQGMGADPLGTESRYRPGDANPAEPPPPKPKNVLPQTEYLSITTANIKVIMKKIGELNEKLLSDGSKELTLNPNQMDSIQSLGAQLEGNPTAITTDHQGLDSLAFILSNWPPANRLPALDLLRLLTAATPAIATPQFIPLLTSSGALTNGEHPNNQMLAVRALANLFNTKAGRTLATSTFEPLHALVKPLLQAPTNRNLTIALGTLYINIAVQCTLEARENPKSSPEVSGRGLTLAEDLCGLLKREKDSEAIYRALVALGTVLLLGDEVRQGANEVFGVQEALVRAESGVKEPRIKGVVREIRDAL